MRTDLVELFRTLAEPHLFIQEPQYARIVKALKSSKTPRVHFTVLRADDLSQAASIGLLLSDAVILSGLIDFTKDDPDLAWPNAHSLTNLFDLPLPAGDRESTSILENKKRYVALGSFDQDSLAPWLRDAEPFIADGRLIYLPQRLIYCDERDTRGVLLRAGVEMYPGWSSWAAERTDDADADLVLPTAPGLEQLNQNMLNIFDVALPFLADLPLRTLHDVMQHEGDSFATFRQKLRGTLGQFLSTPIDTAEEYIRTGMQIRADVIEPEIAKLKKIIETRAIRLAGATLGTIGLLAAAVSSGGLAAAITAGLGAGGAGVLTKEVADFRSDLLSAREEPWYFAWRLHKSAQQ